MAARWLVAVLLAGLWMGYSPGAARAGSTWPGGPPTPWNTPGMAVPRAPAADRLGSSPTDPPCGELARPPETDGDRALVAAGWTLYGTYEAGWGITAVRATAAVDGMCRPIGYQDFVFVDGAFAGTIAPLPMNARTDGAASLATPSAQGEGVTAQFARYTEADPLCCPSATTHVDYRIDRSGPSPVLVPTTATRLPRPP